jgi:hypothetical protein
LIKSVVTDDRGRFVVPDLPSGEYDVWVRGYGLVDSPKVKSSPGKIVNLKAVAGARQEGRRPVLPGAVLVLAAAGAAEERLPGTGDKGNGISPNIKSQGEWIRNIVNTDGCTGCHQMGGPATRTIPGEHPRPVRGHEDGVGSAHPVGTGRRRHERTASPRWAGARARDVRRLDRPHREGRAALSDAVASAGRRAQRRRDDVGLGRSEGLPARRDLERQAAIRRQRQRSDLRALEESGDYFPVVDPKTNTAKHGQGRPRDADTPSSADQPPAAPSPYWADEAIWNTPDDRPQLREWTSRDVCGPRAPSASRRRPAWCQAGSDHPVREADADPQGQRGLIMYDPKTKKVTQIDTCYTWGHLNFDDNDVIWSSFGPAGVEGWFDVKTWDKTHDEKASQGWSAFVIDNNGNGKRDAYTEPNQPADAAKDRRVAFQFYGDSHRAGRIGVGNGAGCPGGLGHFIPGAHPPETAITEFYEVPWNNPKASVQGFAPRGMDVDSKGVVWTVLSSGQLASFDRKKCAGTQNGPTATGQQCVEGWTLYPLPGPNYKGAVENASADSAYYDFVDRFDMLGVGKDIPVAGGNLSGRSARARQRQDRDVPRAVSDGVLHQGTRWPHRQPERRLEGEGDLHAGLDARAVPHGRRQGEYGEAGEVPGAPRPSV